MTHRGLAWQNMHGVVPSLSVQTVVNYIAHDNIGTETRIPRTTLFGKCEKHKYNKVVAAFASTHSSKHQHEHFAHVDA